MSAPDLSVVVPVYRNAETLEELHRRLSRVLEHAGLSFEILFVDDACPEGSGLVLDRLVLADPRVTALSVQENGGQHRAVLLGLSRARGEWTVVMDGDLQDPPEEIPGLLQAGQAGALAVFAGRRGSYESSFRLFTSRVFKRTLHLLCGVPSDAGLFVALRRPAVDRLLSLPRRYPFVVAMIGASRVPMVSVPVVRERRRSGSSAYSQWCRVRSAASAFLWLFLWRLGALARRGSARRVAASPDGRGSHAS
jgi:glycosyltransferase involved in cell wall biosynthesis